MLQRNDRVRFAACFVIASLVWVGAPAPDAKSCPLCGPGLTTISDDLASSDAMVIGQLISTERLPASDDERTDAVRGTFKIVTALKGVNRLKGSSTVSVVYFSQIPAQSLVLLSGIGRPLEWASPLKISSRAGEYLGKLVELPKEGTERLGFFLSYLEDEDPVLAKDSYYEFVKAPYASIRLLADRLPREKLVRWLQNPELSEHRRLYFMLLGLCGQSDDLPMLESLLRTPAEKRNPGADSLIACYLSVKGAEGLPLVEELFLKDVRTNFADTYAAIMALRFHMTETDRLPKERILQSLRHVLAHRQLADLVIPDYTRAQDWSVMDQMVELFKTSDDKTSWVRVPVINYLRACPQPKAKEHLKELERLDPDAVARASTFFPVPPP